MTLPTTAKAGDKGHISIHNAIGSKLNRFVCASDYASIQDAITSLPPNGGTVIIPPGLYTITNPIILKSGTHLVGSGRWGTAIKNLGVGPAIYFDNTSRASLSHLSVILDTVGTQSGVVIEGRQAAPGNYNCIYDVDIYGAAGITPGQTGLIIRGASGTIGNVTVANHVSNLWIEYIDAPIFIEEHTEGNILSDITINTFGSGKVGIGCKIDGHTNQMTNIRFASLHNADLMYGWVINGSGNYLRGIADFGAGYLYNDISHKNNNVDGLVLEGVTGLSSP